MKFNIAKCKVVHIGAKNSGAEYKMEDKKLDEIIAEKDSRVIINSSLKVGKQCGKPPGKGNQILELIKRKKIPCSICTSRWFAHISNTVFRLGDLTWSRIYVYWRRCKRGLRG